VGGKEQNRQRTGRRKKKTKNLPHHTKKTDELGGQK